MFCALDEVGSGSLRLILSELLGTYRTVHLPQVETVIEFGFQLFPTFDRPHFTLRLSGGDDTEISWLIEAFGPAQPNRYYYSQEQPRSRRRDQPRHHL